MGDRVDRLRSPSDSPVHLNCSMARQRQPETNTYSGDHTNCDLSPHCGSYPNWGGDSAFDTRLYSESIGEVTTMQLVLIGLIGLGSAVVVGLFGGLILKANQHLHTKHSV